MQVVVDWDGTVTEVDGLHLVLVEFGDDEIYDAHEARLGRELTLHEVIAGEFRVFGPHSTRSSPGYERTLVCVRASPSSRAGIVL